MCVVRYGQKDVVTGSRYKLKTRVLTGHSTCLNTEQIGTSDRSLEDTSHWVIGISDVLSGVVEHDDLAAFW